MDGPLPLLLVLLRVWLLGLDLGVESNPLVSVDICCIADVIFCDIGDAVDGDSEE